MTDDSHLSSLLQSIAPIFSLGKNHPLEVIGFFPEPSGVLFQWTWKANFFMCVAPVLICCHTKCLWSYKINLLSKIRYSLKGKSLVVEMQNSEARPCAFTCLLFCIWVTCRRGHGWLSGGDVSVWLWGKAGEDQLSSLSTTVVQMLQTWHHLEGADLQDIRSHLFHSLCNVCIVGTFHLRGSFNYCSLIFLIDLLMNLGRTFMKETGLG